MFAVFFPYTARFWAPYRAYRLYDCFNCSRIGQCCPRLLQNTSYIVEPKDGEWEGRGVGGDAQVKSYNRLNRYIRIDFLIIHRIIGETMALIRSLIASIA